MTDNFWWIDFVLSKEDREVVKSILKRLDNLSRMIEVYPASENVFRAFCNLGQAKVILLGQDPYHGPGQANGFAFAVNEGMPLPPSLSNIFKELKDDIGDYKADRTLEQWDREGVSLLNTTLTVSRGLPGSHADLGWEKITGKLISYLSSTKECLVFILWGLHAQRMSKYIENYDKHLVIKSPHPSPFSAHKGFFGSKPFSRTNAYLIQHNISPIEW
jgi:uracil-DNA glycosylase